MNGFVLGVTTAVTAGSTQTGDKARECSLEPPSAEGSESAQLSYSEAL